MTPLFSVNDEIAFGQERDYNKEKSAEKIIFFMQSDKLEGFFLK